MPPKHPLGSHSSTESTEEAYNPIKRSKSSSTPDRDREQPQFKHATPLSRSETPAEVNHGAKVVFSVVYPAMTEESKKKLPKGKTAQNEEWEKTAEWQESPFKARGAAKEGELNQHYTVLPADEWSSMKRYNNFIIQGEVYKNDTIVYVRGPTTNITTTSPPDYHAFWVARILQVRAKNAQNVYALVAWMYWPEELPGLKGKREPGAQSYHGKFELVASNYMEVLDVLSFAGKVDASHYLEEDDVISTKLFWRQTFCRETQELSKIKERCICKGHFNPDHDKQMFICDNKECELWLHKDCIIHSALLATHKRLIEDPSSNGTSTQSKKKPLKKPYAGKFSAKLVEGVEGVDDILVEIVDLRSGKKRETWREEALCLECGTKLLR